jgi:hypothetical protein
MKKQTRKKWIEECGCDGGIPSARCYTILSSTPTWAQSRVNPRRLLHNIRRRLLDCSSDSNSSRLSTTVHTAMTSRAGYVCCPPHSVFWKWNMIHQNDDDRAEWTERNMPVFFRLFLFAWHSKKHKKQKIASNFSSSSSSFFERLLYTRSHAVPCVSLVCWAWMREVAMNIYPVCRVFSEPWRPANI